MLYEQVIQFLIRSFQKSREWMYLYDKLYHHMLKAMNTNLLQRKPQASGSHTESFLMKCIAVVHIDVSLIYFKEVEKMLHIPQEFIVYSCMHQIKYLAYHFSFDSLNYMINYITISSELRNTILLQRKPQASGSHTEFSDDLYCCSSY